VKQLLLLTLGCVLMTGCGGSDTETVVVYTALDEMYSRPILDAFEAETGWQVDAVYDTEAAKTTGLVTRLISEASRPRADVFWNNEVAQTILLQEKGVLAPYASANAKTIPPNFKDLDHFWTGFAARARVIIYNTDLLEQAPQSVLELTDPKWAGKASIAIPLFGTTATHAGALYALWGEEKALQWFKDVKANDIAILSGNATVRDLVAQGEYAWGLTDTDDANGAIEDGLPADWIFPDQAEGGLGTLLIPNTVALVANSPQPEGGKALIDFLLRPETERVLANMRSIQIPLHPGVEAPEKVPDIADIKPTAVTFADMAAQMEKAMTQLREVFLE
jgi:iron(III) transport system substrate-binding protein